MKTHFAIADTTPFASVSSLHKSFKPPPPFKPSAIHPVRSAEM
jgi:hypothetical protein